MKTQYFILWADELEVAAIIAANTNEELNDKLRTAINEHFSIVCELTKKAELTEDFYSIQDIECEDSEQDLAYDLQVQRKWSY
jgi:hypothetical protein